MLTSPSHKGNQMNLSSKVNTSDLQGEETNRLVHRFGRNKNAKEDEEEGKSKFDLDENIPSELKQLRTRDNGTKKGRVFSSSAFGLACAKLTAECGEAKQGAGLECANFCPMRPNGIGPSVAVGVSV
jgi:hypothetical protein